MTKEEQRLWDILLHHQHDIERLIDELFDLKKADYKNKRMIATLDRVIQNYQKMLKEKNVTHT